MRAPTYDKVYVLQRKFYRSGIRLHAIIIKSRPMVLFYIRDFRKSWFSFWFKFLWQKQCSSVWCRCSVVKADHQIFGRWNPRLPFLWKFCQSNFSKNESYEQIAYYEKMYILSDFIIDTVNKDPKKFLVPKKVWSNKMFWPKKKKFGK